VKASQCAEVLERANPPPVIVRESWSARMNRDIDERQDDP
jgi:hypothetical protein